MIHLAIITPNALTALGLHALVQQVMPAINIATFGSWAEAEQKLTTPVGHLFVDECLMPPPTTSLPTQRTIVLTTQKSTQYAQPMLDVSQPANSIVQDLLQMMRQGHYHPSPTTHHLPSPLTPREREVLQCVVKGMINKEIADELHISLTTVITHRKNITQKLNVKSAAGLTLYAIIHGLADPMTILPR